MKKWLWLLLLIPVTVLGAVRYGIIKEEWDTKLGVFPGNRRAFQIMRVDYPDSICFVTLYINKSTITTNCLNKCLDCSSLSD